MNPNLVLPRRLAIQILHEAQIAQPQSISGWVMGKDGAPQRYVAGEASASFWARVFSRPTSAAVPSAEELKVGGLHLVISLNTKGVLEMRAWELAQGQPAERVLTIKD